MTGPKEKGADLYVSVVVAHVHGCIDKAAPYRDALVNRKPRYLWLTGTRTLLSRSLSDKWKDARVVWRCVWYGRFLRNVTTLDERPAQQEENGAWYLEREGTLS